MYLCRTFYTLSRFLCKHSTWCVFPLQTHTKYCNGLICIILQPSQPPPSEMFCLIVSRRNWNSLLITNLSTQEKYCVCFFGKLIISPLVQSALAQSGVNGEKCWLPPSTSPSWPTFWKWWTSRPASWCRSWTSRQGRVHSTVSTTSPSVPLTSYVVGTLNAYVRLLVQMWQSAERPSGLRTRHSWVTSDVCQPFTKTDTSSANAFSQSIGGLVIGLSTATQACVCAYVLKKQLGFFWEWDFNILVCAETAMGKKIYAQSNSDSEYVKSVYKWVNLSWVSVTKTRTINPNLINNCIFSSFVERMSDIISRRQRTPWFWSDLVYYLFGDGQLHNKTLSVLHSFTYKVSNWAPSSFPR